MIYLVRLTAMMMVDYSVIKEDSSIREAGYLIAVRTMMEGCLMMLKMSIVLSLDLNLENTSLRVVRFRPCLS